jgi:hypothetical protein
MTEYTAADLTVLEFDQSVRRRPGMYFGADPHLATSILTKLTYHLDESFFTPSTLAIPTLAIPTLDLHGRFRLHDRRPR